MRIISGTARGRRLYTPGRGAAISLIRPTADRVREAVFNILGDRVSVPQALDLFAGTGAMGLEALSRGCSRVVFVDGNHNSIRLIKKNIDTCGFADTAKIIRRDLLKRPGFLQKLMPRGGFDLIFVDPPYRRGILIKTLKYLGELALLSNDGIIVAEEAAEVELAEEIVDLQMIDRRVYGDTSICFYRKRSCESQDE